MDPVCKEDVCRPREELNHLVSSWVAPSSDPSRRCDTFCHQSRRCLRSLEAPSGTLQDILTRNGGGHQQVGWNPGLRGHCTVDHAPRGTSLMPSYTHLSLGGLYIYLKADTKKIISLFIVRKFTKKTKR